MVFQFVFFSCILEDNLQIQGGPLGGGLGLLLGLVWSINKKQIIRKKQLAPKKVKIVGAVVNEVRGRCGPGGRIGG